MRTALLTGIVAIIFTCSSFASLITLTPTREGDAFACLGRPGCNIAREVVQVPGGLATLSASYGSSALGATLIVDAIGQATYGTISAGASSTYSISGTPGTAYAMGAASFEDVLTVSFDPLTGQKGLLVFQYTLSGSTSASGGANAFALVNIAVGKPNSEQLWGIAHAGSTNGIYTVPYVFTFTYGQPFGVLFHLASLTGTAVPALGGAGGVGYLPGIAIGTGTSSANFFNTFTLTNILVADASGTQLNNATIAASSGTNYVPQTPGEIPEPASAALVGLGGCFIVTLLVHRNRRGQKA